VLLAGDFWGWQTALVAFAGLGEVLSVVFVYRVLTRGGSTASTLLWMIFILAAPWLGLLAYYLLPRRLQLRRLKRVRKRSERLLDARGDDGDAESPPGDLEHLLDLNGGLSDGNALRWIPSGKEFFELAAEQVRGARHYLHCVVYILRPDETGLAFLKLMTEAARRGVEVRLCYDSFGSMGLKAHHLAPLHEAGGHTVPFLPLFWKKRPFTVNLRNHRKLLIVDGEVGYLGGRNIGDEYRLDRLGNVRRWFDAMIEVRGPALEELQAVFVQDWCTAADEVIEPPFWPEPSRPGNGRVGIVGSGPDQGRSVLWYALAQQIGEARHTVTLCSPYLVLPETLLFVLELAVARGVKVRIYTNGKRAEAWLLYHAQRHRYRFLLEAGVEVFETIEQYNHAKFLVVDDRTVFVGSANMDLRSAHLNFELAAVALDAPDLARDVMQTVADRAPEFRQLTLETLPNSPRSRAVDGLCALFSPLL